MKTLELNYNHWSNRWVRMTYGLEDYNMPSNTCALGWYYIFLLPCTFIFFPSYIRESILGRKEQSTNVLSRFISSVCITVLTVCVLASFFVTGTKIRIELFDFIPDNANLLSILISCVLGGLAIGLFIASVVGSVIGLASLKDKLSRPRYYYPVGQKPSFIKTWIQNKKEKSCSKIEWKNGED